MRNRSLIRALSLKQTLDGGQRWTLRNLADRFSVSTRTIRRDLAALEDAGVPLCHETHIPGNIYEHGLWWIA